MLLYHKYILMLHNSTMSTAGTRK